MARKSGSLNIQFWVMVALAIAVSVYLVMKYFFDIGRVSVTSQVNGHEYLVRDLPDKQDAADMMANLCTKATDFTDYLMDKYPNDPRSQALKENFKCNIVKEGAHRWGLTAYTVNKGAELVLCLRDTRDEIHPENLLMFVLLHEMAHMASVSFSLNGHNEEFRQNFAWLKEEAQAFGIYSPLAVPTSYCGVKITHA